jgi:hypothetical protein
MTLTEAMALWKDEKVQATMRSMAFKPNLEMVMDMQMFEALTVIGRFKMPTLTRMTYADARRVLESSRPYGALDPTWPSRGQTHVVLSGQLNPNLAEAYMLVWKEHNQTVSST